jgi:hypothetical protein
MRIIWYFIYQISIDLNLLEAQKKENQRYHLWVVMSCCLVEMHQRSEGAYCSPSRQHGVTS